MRQKLSVILRNTLYCALTLQCLFGVLWLIGNLGHPQEFAQTTSPLYALLAGIFEKLLGFVGLGKGVAFSVLFLAQLAVGFLAVKYALDTFWGHTEKGNKLHIFGAAAILSVPQVLQCAFSPLPVFPAAAGLLTLGTMAFKGCRIIAAGSDAEDREADREEDKEADKEVGKETDSNRKQVAYRAMKMCLIWILSAMLLPEYGVFGLFFVFPYIWKLCKAKKMQPAIWAAVIATPVLMVGAYIGLYETGYLTKQENALMLSAVSRFVGPDMQHNHKDWPEDFKAVIDWNTAGLIALTTDGVENVMHPIMRASLTEKECNRIYLQLVKKAILLRKKSIAKSVTMDFLSYMFPPYLVPKHLDGIAGDSFTGRNYEIMKANTPLLTKWYVRYGGFCFFLCVIAVFFRAFTDKERVKGFKSEVLLLLCMCLYYTMAGSGRMDYKLAVFMIFFWMIRAVNFMLSNTESVEK